MPSPLSRSLTKLLAGLLPALLAFAIVACASMYGFLDRLEHLGGDGLRRQLAKPLHPDIQLVYLDKESLDRAEKEFETPWPWPRNIYGQVLRFLKSAGAKAVLFDMLYTSASSQGPEDDREFAKALKSFNGTYAGFQALESAEGSLKEFNALPDLYSVPIQPDSRLHAAIGADYPHPPLWGAFTGLGDVNFIPDTDGMDRQVRLFTKVGDRVYPHLALSTYWNLRGRPQLSLSDDQLQVEGHTLSLDPGFRIDLLFRSIPKDRASSIFDLATSGQALEEGRKPVIDPAKFKDKIILIGSSAPGLRDLRPIPTDEKAPGLLIYANALDNLLTGQSLRVVPVQGNGWLFLFLLCLAVSILMVRLPGLGMAALPLLLTGAWIGWAYHEYDAANTLLPIATPLTALWVCAALATAERFTLEARRKRGIQTAFGQFLSQDVLKHLMAEHEPLKLGGQKQVMTLFFSDLEGFTSFSEKLDSQQLVSILNHYLTEMGEMIVGQCEGYVDKYEGDAIMAFWGAPIPQSDHALLACRAAWRCQKRLAAIQPELAQMGLPVGSEGLVMRIGINTGDAVVGLMGSQRKLNYTAMGDTVNLASRLEGTNKVYKTRIIVSHAAVQAAGKTAHVRELDLIQVKGKKEPTQIYELIGIEGEGEDLLTADYLSSWNEGLTLYRKKDFKKASASFEACLKIRPKDGPAVLYKDRCVEFQKNPPPPDWNGVHVMTSK